MELITQELIDAALNENPWDLGNGILYKLCSEYPKHSEDSEIVAKIWLIGRSYAAAIERRKPNNDTSIDNDDFYLNVVLPAIKNSDIDKWIRSLMHIEEVNEDNLASILHVHMKVTKLLSEISGLDKRSLASKYLHFHYPKLFFIYDSRAVSAISKLSEITGRVGRSKFQEVDNEYRKFFEKCLKVQIYINEVFGYSIIPRQLDNILLKIVNND